MNQPNRSRYHIVAVCFVSYLLISIDQLCVGIGDHQNKVSNEIEIKKEASQSKATKMINTFKTLFALQTNYVHLAFRRCISYFAPPNLDFRGGGVREEEEEGGMAEAVVKSFDKSKATVEESAKSAAKLAEEAIRKTVKKVKKTLSKNEKVASDHELEL